MVFHCVCFYLTNSLFIHLLKGVSFGSGYPCNFYIFSSKYPSSSNGWTFTSSYVLYLMKFSASGGLGQPNYSLINSVSSWWRAAQLYLQIPGRLRHAIDRFSASQGICTPPSPNRKGLGFEVVETVFWKHPPGPVYNLQGPMHNNPRVSNSRKMHLKLRSIENCECETEIIEGLPLPLLCCPDFSHSKGLK